MGYLLRSHETASETNKQLETYARLREHEVISHQCLIKQDLSLQHSPQTHSLEVQEIPSNAPKKREAQKETEKTINAHTHTPSPHCMDHEDK